MWSHPEQAYLDILRHVYENGIDRENGTDKQDPAYQEWVTTTWTRGLFGAQMRFDLQQWFPLLTTKKVYHKAIFHELIRLISGSTNIEYLCQNKVRIWDDRPFMSYQKSSEYQWEDMREFAQKIASDHEFATKWGELWPVYGQQRRFRPKKDGWYVDQLAKAIHKIKTNPESRRIIVSARNAEYIEQMALPPCHAFFQFHVANGKLSCQLYQRSADMFLGVPFNIASYSLLTHMIAQVAGLEAWDFVHTIGDIHIYDNHFPQVEEQLSRTPKPLPSLKLNPKIKNIDDFGFDDIQIIGYDPHPPIKAKVSL